MLAHLCILLLLVIHCEAFQRPLRHRHLSLTSKSIPLSTTQLYNKEDEEEDKGYGILGSFTRFGLQPAFIRIFQNQKYEDAVTKWMQASGEPRSKAMASMEYYFFDPAGWQLNRMQGKNMDYLNAGQSKSQLALTALWAVLITPALVYGTNYWYNYWTTNEEAVFWTWSPQLVDIVSPLQPVISP